MATGHNLFFDGEFFFFLSSRLFIQFCEYINYLPAFVPAAVGAHSMGGRRRLAVPADGKTQRRKRVVRPHPIALSFGMPHSYYHNFGKLAIKIVVFPYVKIDSLASVAKCKYNPILIVHRIRPFARARSMKFMGLETNVKSIIFKNIFLAFYSLLEINGEFAEGTKESRTVFNFCYFSFGRHISSSPHQ